MTTVLSRRRLSLAAALLAGLPLRAAAHDPEVVAQDGFGYRASRTHDPFVDVSGAQRLPLGDRSGVTVPLGFSFTLYGETYSSVGVTSEGYLTFGGPVTGTPLPLPDSVFLSSLP